MNIDFDTFYHSIYGGRWPTLRESLLSPGSPLPYKEGLTKPYMMDEASVIAAQALRIPKEGIILDACAAPGGKSLVIASRLSDQTELLCNELSAERRGRLSKVLDEYLDEKIRVKVKVSGFDAAKLGGKKTERERFDAILLDAPCSSERHVIQSEAALAKWTPARTRFLSQRQWSLLSAAFLLLKPGGSLVYVTCSVSPEENDGVVNRLYEKYNSLVIPDGLDISEGEKTQYGRIILPDQSGNMGPMYIARFRKNENSIKTSKSPIRFLKVP